MFEDQYVTCDHVCFIIRVFLDHLWAAWYLNKIRQQVKKKKTVLLFFIFLSCFHNFIYSSIFGHAESSLLKGLLSSCGMQASRRGASRYGAWAPGRTGSGGLRAQAYRPLACGIFLDQGSNPCLAHWQVGSLPLRHQESPSLCYSFKCCDRLEIVHSRS